MPELYENPVMLRHYRNHLALHQLADRGTPTLLLLHGLGGEAPTAIPGYASSWPGSVHALDFTGHGASTRPIGGGYTCEILMADVDVALARIGPATIVGHGLGAYIALLIAGARPELVRGAVLADGTGLAGGATGPTSPVIVAPPSAEDLDDVVARAEEPDPFALIELSRDVRPPDYASTYARLAVAGSSTDPALVVATTWLPAWLEAVAAEPGVVRDSLDVAIARYIEQATGT